MIDVGIYPDLSNEDYHNDKNSISRSGLMDFDKSPFNYWAFHINPDRPEKKTTDKMELGTAFHMLMLERDLFDKTYVMKPDPVFLKHHGREAYDKYKGILEFLETCKSIVLSCDEWETLMRMKAVFERNKDAMNLISGARIENSFFWQDEHSGLMLKSRPDILHSNMIVDLKTCRDASPRGFQNSMMEGGNHIQGSMIRDAVEILEGNRINTVINILIENKYPHAMGIYIIDEAALDYGHSKYKQLCLDLKNCLDKNEWQDYGVQTVSLPPWALK